MLYVPNKDTHKGQNGKLLVVAGSPKYHGSALFTLLAARRFVDLLYFMPAKPCPYLIQAVKMMPEVIVVPNLEIAKEVDAVVYGPGSDNAGLLNSILNKRKRVVIDGDGLKEVEGKLPAEAIITPHEGEFQHLCSKFSCKTVKQLANELGCVVLKKGIVDIISDGKAKHENKHGNPGLTKGGSGDALAGFVGALLCKNDAMTAAKTGVEVFTKAADRLMNKKGYYYTIKEVIERVPAVLEEYL